MIASASLKNIKVLALPNTAVPTPPQISLHAGQRIRAVVTVTNIGQATDRFGLMGWVYPVIRSSSWVLDRVYLFWHVSGADGQVTCAGTPVMYFYLSPGQSRQITVQSDAIYQYQGYAVFGINWQAGVLENLTESSMSWKTGTIDAGHWDNVIILV